MTKTIPELTEKATPVDSDEVEISDQGASSKRCSVANLFKAAAFDTNVKTIRLDEMAAPTSDVSMNSKKLTNLLAGTGALDGVNKAQLDALAQGVIAKAPVRVASTAAQTLATEFENGDTIDGVVLATGDRILIKDQAAGAENGIYTVEASGAPTRGVDFDADVEVIGALVIRVSEGTLNGNTAWMLTTDDAITVGSTALVFSLMTQLQDLIAGTGLDKSGNTLNIDSSVLTTATKLDEMAAPTDITTRDATTSLHGLMPKIDKVKMDKLHIRKEVQIIITEATVVAIVENDVGAVLLNIGPLLAGMNLVSAEAVVATAGTTGTLDIQLRNKTQAADILTNKIQVASGAILSDNGESINASEDDMQLNDQIAVDIDVIHTTPSKGLTIILGFETP